MKRRILTGIMAGLLAFGVCACGQTETEQTDVTETEPVSEAAAEAEPAAPEEIETEETADVVEETEETEDAAEPEYPSLPLPAYHYAGPEDWAAYGDAAAQFLIENSFGDEASDLDTCTPVIFKVDETDPADVKAWGAFWVDRYQLCNTTLSRTAGGEYGGIAHFDTTGGSPIVTDMETLEDGDGYSKSMEKLFGAEGLSEDYAKAMDDMSAYRAQALSYYINENALYITQFQDFGWPPVSIPNAPETRDEDQQIWYVSNFAYTTSFDMRQLCVSEMGEDGDLFSSVESDAWSEILVTVSSERDKDMEGLVKELNTNTEEEADWKEYEREDGLSFGGKEECVRLRTPEPYKDGQEIHTIYLIPREEDILAVNVGSDYTEDEEKQMATDGIIEALLGNMEIK